MTIHISKKCKKCGFDDWGAWTSSSNGKTHRYCRKCRRNRAYTYSMRKNANGGKHSISEWNTLLKNSDRCVICKRYWKEIPPRPDKRYKHVWTKDHIIPISKKGTDQIENIQVVCYQCNFEKNNKDA